MAWLQLANEYLAANGWRWSAHATVARVARKLGLDSLERASEQRMRGLESKYNLPGRHSVRTNRRIWTEWDWNQRGEEWTHDEAFKQSIIQEVMGKHLRPDTRILEIGPGGGRWTEALEPLAAQLVLVDLSESCIQVCKERFAQSNKIEFHVNDGCTLDFLDTDSLDHIWSYDVFVHISPKEAGQYLKEFARVLRSGGRAVIHHPGEGGGHGGWRSNMTASRFRELLEEHQLKLVDQFDSWGPNGEHDLGAYKDVITVFERAR